MVTVGSQPPSSAANFLSPAPRSGPKRWVPAPTLIRFFSNWYMPDLPDLITATLSLIRFSPPTERPPPEPPPRDSVLPLLGIDGLLLLRSSWLPHSMSEPPTLALAPSRTPPKPPDIGNCSFPERLMFDFGYAKFAIEMNVKHHFSSAFWIYINSVVQLLAHNFGCIFFAYLRLNSEQALYDFFETTHSRIEPIIAPKMIRNWIDLKTVASLLFLVIDCRRKASKDWLIGYSPWFAVLLFSTPFTYKVAVNLGDLIVIAGFLREMFWTTYLFSSTFWTYGDWVELLLFDAYCCIRSADLGLTSALVLFDSFETTHSRTEPILVTKIIRNWIDVKTVASLLFVVIDRGRKAAMSPLIGYWFWSHPLMISTFVICNVDARLGGLSTRVGFLGRWGMPLYCFVIVFVLLCFVVY